MLIVNENLFEFKKGMDPVDSLDMGRRKLIKEWLDFYSVTRYTINNDYTIDVNNAVYLPDKNLKQLPEIIQFNKVELSFWIHNNALTSLRGCPLHTGGSFSCSDNKLSSLDFIPLFIGRNLFCNNNDIHFSIDYIRSKSNIINHITN